MHEGHADHVGGLRRGGCQPEEQGQDGTSCCGAAHRFSLCQWIPDPAGTGRPLDPVVSMLAAQARESPCAAPGFRRLTTLDDVFRLPR